MEAAAARDEKKLTREKAEKTEELIRMMEATILGIGDPERQIRESLEREVGVDFLREEMQDMKMRLAEIEKEKTVLVTTDGENAAAWERRIETDVKAKFRAALLVGAEGIRKLEAESPTAVSGPHTATVMSRSRTKRELVSLPKFEGC